MEHQTHKASFKIGRLKKGDWKNKIKVFCFHSDIEVKLDEDNSFLETNLLYEFKGPAEKLENLKKFLDGLINPYQPLFDEQKARNIVAKYGKFLEQPLADPDNTLITFWGLRPEAELENSVEDVAAAIKQVLLLTSEQELRQALVDGYVGLANIINEEYFKKILEMTDQDKKDNIEHQKLNEQIFIHVTSHVEAARKALELDLSDFQLANGYY